MTKIGINFRKALSEHTDSLKKVTKKLEIKETVLVSDDADVIRADLISYLERNWHKFIEHSNW